MTGVRPTPRDGSTSAGAVPAGRDSDAARTRRGIVPDWRTAAAWWVRRELGTPPDGLIRIVDVRLVADREAWVSLETDGSHVVVGLRHEPVAAAGTFTADDGWYRLLYLTVVDPAGELRGSRSHETRGGASAGPRPEKHDRCVERPATP